MLCGGELTLEVGEAGLLAGGKGSIDLGPELVFQVVADLAGAGIDDAVDAEIEVGLVDLEDLAELGDELLERGGGGRGGGEGFGHGKEGETGRIRTLQEWREAGSIPRAKKSRRRCSAAWDGS